MPKQVSLGMLVVATLQGAPATFGRIAVSANDAHLVNVNGRNTTPKDAPLDTLSISDFSLDPQGACS